MRGLIVKGIGGFYYIQTEKGIIEAKGRGIFKNKGITLCVGDEVNVTLTDEDEKTGVIDEIFPRKNHFIRPPIANVDMFIVVFAAAEPEPNFPVIDKFLITARLHGIEPIVCINKCDLLTDEEVREIARIYESEYKVLCISTVAGQNMEVLKSAIAGKRVALAGPSGVGKSSILNLLHPQANMETGEVSKKTKRGKHTTRHVEIFKAEGGSYIFDTPGFTSFDISAMEYDQLVECFPEFEKLAGSCKYDNCRHLKEPECAVREAVKVGKIHPSRYKSYVLCEEELRKKKQY